MCIHLLLEPAVVTNIMAFKKGRDMIPSMSETINISISIQNQRVSVTYNVKHQLLLVIIFHF